MEIFDNYIPETIRNDLVHDNEYQERPMGTYTFWDMKDFDNPNSKIERALHHIWKDRINKDDFINGGIEWWINKSDGPASNPWHLDLVEEEHQTEYQSDAPAHRPPVHSTDASSQPRRDSPDAGRNGPAPAACGPSP